VRALRAGTISTENYPNKLNPMKLTRPLNCIDIESTGLEIRTDRILSLAIVQTHTDGTRLPFNWMFNPERPIPPESTKIHGITDAMVAGCKPFREHAREIMTVIAGCDLSGFNLANFDVPILWEELYRAGCEWDMQGVHIVDAGTIFKRMEERSLEAAVQFYCGRKHEGAHNAMADVKATMDVFEAQIAGFGQFLADAYRLQAENIARYMPLTEMTVQQLSDFCAVNKDGNRRLDLAGTILLNKDGVPVFGTKRNRGVPIEADPGYCQWILRTDFPTQTHKVLEKILNELYEQNIQDRMDKANDKAPEDDGQEALF
jgi:DNA polymerase-3 subunit epsilon